MDFIYCTREVNHNKRYLKLSIYKTLFPNLYMVEQIFGSVANSKPTGVIKKYFNTYKDSKEYLTKYVEQKKRKGYIDKKVY